MTISYENQRLRPLQFSAGAERIGTRSINSLFVFSIASPIKERMRHATL